MGGGLRSTNIRHEEVSGELMNGEVNTEVSGGEVSDG